MGVDLSLPAAPLSVLETVLYAHDLVAIEDFYRRVLGLEPFSAVADRHIFYRCGNQMLLIFNPNNTRNSPAPGSLPVPPHGAEGPGHVCFRASSEEIANWRTRLEALGVPIEADFEWPRGGRSIYFRDPAGNCLEFAEPRIWGVA
jgi:catechol 2,3-dioxygenase-like lactoylglutathione lyase family enzyme